MSSPAWLKRAVEKTKSPRYTLVTSRGVLCILDREQGLIAPVRDEYLARLALEDLESGHKRFEDLASIKWKEGV